MPSRAKESDPTRIITQPRHSVAEFTSLNLAQHLLRLGMCRSS